MKIAVVFPSFTGPYGAERLVLNLCSELIKLDHNVTLFTPRFDNSCKEMLHPKVRLEETGMLKIKNWDISKFLELFFIARIYKKLTADFDIINIHNYPTPLVAAFAKIFKKIKTPIVYQCNEPPRILYDLSKESYQRMKPLMRLIFKLVSPLLRKLDRWSLQYVDTLIVISKFMKEETTRIYGKESIFIMPGIETKNFTPNIKGDTIRKKYAKNGDFIILTSNKLHPRKRIDVLIRAISYVLKKHKNIKVLITGSGIEKKKLQKLIVRLNIQKHVSLLGYITERELPKYYAACDVFAFTAIREPQIGSPAEALASGKPVIAPNDGSPAETIIEGQTGFLYKPLNSRDLAKKIIWCIEHDNYLKKMSKDCRKWVEENMTWKKMTQETLKVFKKHLFQ